MNILFICTGNTCRSPMASAIAKEYISTTNFSDINILSTGLFSLVGSAPAPNAVAALKEINLDISAHTATSINEYDLNSIDLFFVMSEMHKKTLENLDVNSSKVKILGYGIPDPFGMDLDIYRICRDQLVNAVHIALKEVLSS